MTRKTLYPNDLDALRKESAAVVQDYTAIASLEKEIDEFRAEVSKKEAEKKKIQEKYENKSGGYAPKNSLSEFGILTLISGREDSSEVYIKCIDGDKLTVYFYPNYNHFPKENIISASELLEKGFVKIEGWGFICNRIPTAEGVFEVMRYLFGKEKTRVLQEIGYAKQSMEQATKRLNENEEKLKMFDNIPDEELEKMFDHISWYCTDLTKQQVLDHLPRKVSI